MLSDSQPHIEEEQDLAGHREELRQDNTPVGHVRSREVLEDYDARTDFPVPRLLPLGHRSQHGYLKDDQGALGYFSCTQLASHCCVHQN